MRNVIGVKTLEIIAAKILEQKQVDKLMNEVENTPTQKRNGKQPPPKGGISIRAASRKYGILHGTLSKWAAKGKVKILELTKNWLYLDEKSLIGFLSSRRSNGETMR